MPFENYTINEPVTEPTPKKISKLSIILLILILLSGLYLAYAIYQSNQSDSNAQQDNLSSVATTTETIPNENTFNTNTPESTITSGQAQYTVSQVAEKNSKASCWTIINGNVYDITSYVPNHPGGEDEIVKICGKDGSQLFAKPMEHKEGGADNILSKFKIGTLAK